MKNKNKPVGRYENIVVQEMDGEVLIYDLLINKAFCLNETSAFVWRQCDGTKDVAEIAGLLEKHLGAGANEDVVWLALDQLGRENLLSPDTRPASKFGGMSRREVIKKVGLASAVALPVVTSLVAPLAVHANSACTGGSCTCTTNGTIGAICPTATPCADTNCLCRRVNNGSTNLGNCVP